MSLLKEDNNNQNTYFVTVIETLKKRVEVDAESEEDAISKVESAYKKCDIILDEKDFTGVKFKISKVVENNTEDYEEIVDNN
jgi:hypothetical protein